MKYENLEQCMEICKNIKTLQQELSELERAHTPDMKVANIKVYVGDEFTFLSFINKSIILKAIEEQIYDHKVLIESLIMRLDKL